MSSIILPFPHAGQRIVRSQARRFNLLAAGRRWRKTTLVMALTVEGALKTGRFIWGAPTYDQVTVAWEEMKQAARKVFDFNTSRMTVTAPNGARVVFRSLDDPDNARGHTGDGVVMDECADVAESAWHEVLRPMLIDTNGWAWLIGTPKGRNWYWREHANAADRADTKAWTAPTLGVKITESGLIRCPHPLENPEIPFDEILQIYRTTPERTFRQEILAEFIENSGGVFRGVESVVSKDRTENEAANPGMEYSGGIDLARVNDFTVLTVFDATGRQVYFERFNQISWERQLEAISRVAKLFPRCTFWLDSTGVGDPIFEQCRKRGIAVRGYQFTNASKEALIDNYAMRIENRGVDLMNVPVQTAELQAYQYELTPSRNVRMNAPQGMHDDTVIGGALGVWGLGKRVDFHYAIS